MSGAPIQAGNTVLPWTTAAGGVSLHVRLTPKGGRDAADSIETMSDGRAVLKIRVRAAPTDGEANDALLRFLAKAIGVPLRDLTIAAGATSRIKRIAIAGHAPTILAALEKLPASR